MLLKTISYVCIACLLVGTSARCIWALDPDLAGTDGDQVEAKLIALRKEYKLLADDSVRLEREITRSIPSHESENNLSDAEWLKRDREIYSKVPRTYSQLLPRFVALAKNHPDSPFAINALAFAIQKGGPHTGDVHGEPWRIKERAIDMVLEHHMNDPRVVHVFDLLSGSLPSRKTESFLRQAFEKSPDRTTRAAAGLCLARYFAKLDKDHHKCKQLKKKKQLPGNERSWRTVACPYLKENFAYDDGELSAEIERLAAHVMEKYSDIQAVDWKWAGPSRVFLQTEAYPQPKTYGDLAKAMLFQLNDLVPGKKAPDIEGLDAEGNRFRLSDYQRKVVLLTFSANWCGGCVKLYPMQRDLVNKFRDEPFVLLSVSQDESIDTLQASLASGEITWRCWWDGLDGPIRNVWNNRGVPGIILLDNQHIIQDVLLNRFTLQEEFENEIAVLLSKIRATKTPTR